MTTINTRKSIAKSVPEKVKDLNVKYAKRYSEEFRGVTFCNEGRVFISNVSFNTEHLRILLKDLTDLQHFLFTKFEEIS